MSLCNKSINNPISRVLFLRSIIISVSVSSSPLIRFIGRQEDKNAIDRPMKSTYARISLMIKEVHEHEKVYLYDGNKKRSFFDLDDLNDLNDIKNLKNKMIRRITV